MCAGSTSDYSSLSPEESHSSREGLLNTSKEDSASSPTTSQSEEEEKEEKEEKVKKEEKEEKSVSSRRHSWAGGITPGNEIFLVTKIFIFKLLLEV